MKFMILIHFLRGLLTFLYSTGAPSTVEKSLVTLQDRRLFLGKSVLSFLPYVDLDSIALDRYKYHSLYWGVFVDFFFPDSLAGSWSASGEERTHICYSILF